jgi:hypothetical protein
MLPNTEINQLKNFNDNTNKMFTGDHGSATHTGHGSKLHVSYSTGFRGNCAQY